MSPTSQTLHSVVVRESLLQAAQRFGWTGADAKAGADVKVGADLNVGADLKVGPYDQGAQA